MTDYSNTSVYLPENDYAQVNTTASYNTLGNYYRKPNCPYQTRPGQCEVHPVVITPTFGGNGYRNLQHNLTSVPESNYFTISNAYPAWPYSPCMKPLVS